MLSDGDEAHALDAEGRVIGQRLEEAPLRRVEHQRLTVRDAKHADGTIADTQRQQQRTRARRVQPQRFRADRLRASGHGGHAHRPVDALDGGTTTVRHPVHESRAPGEPNHPRALLPQPDGSPRPRDRG
jgi:hypothetical protein